MSLKYKVGEDATVTSGLVWEAWQYKFSPAIDYYTKEHGLLVIDHL